MPPKKKKTKKVKSAEAPVTRNVKRREDCPDCGSTNIIFDPDTERLICQDCGSIFEELPPELERKYAEVDML